MKFSGKMCLLIILKVAQNQGFTLSIENAVLEKPQGWIKLTLPAFLALNRSYSYL